MTQQIDPELLAAFRKAVRANIRREILEERAEAERTRAQVLEQLARLVAEARHNGLAGRVWLFGSFAWGLPGVRSDIDLMIEEGGQAADDLASLIWAKCGRPVHAFPLADAPPSLRERVLQDGKQL